MNLYIDKNTGNFITDPAFKSEITKVDFKRGDAATLSIGFVTGTTQALLGGTPLVIFAIKESGKYDSVDSLVYEDSFVEGASTYDASPNFNTTDLNDLLFSGDADDTNDVAYVDAMLEVTFSDDNGVTWQSSKTITARIYNDVVKGNEGTVQSG